MVFLRLRGQLGGQYEKGRAKQNWIKCGTKLEFSNCLFMFLLYRDNNKTILGRHDPDKRWLVLLSVAVGGDTDLCT